MSPRPSPPADGPDVPRAGSQLAWRWAWLGAGTRKSFAQVFGWVLGDILQDDELLQVFKVFAQWLRAGEYRDVAKILPMFSPSQGCQDLFRIKSDVHVGKSLAWELLSGGTKL